MCSQRKRYMYIHTCPAERKQKRVPSCNCPQHSVRHSSWWARAGFKSILAAFFGCLCAVHKLHNCTQRSRGPQPLLLWGSKQWLGTKEDPMSRVLNWRKSLSRRDHSKPHKEKKKKKEPDIQKQQKSWVVKRQKGWEKQKQEDRSPTTAILYLEA